VHIAVFPAGTPDNATDFFGLNSDIICITYLEIYLKLLHIYSNQLLDKALL